MSPTPAVKATEVAGNIAAHDMSMAGLFAQSDFIVKFVIIALFLASIFSWAIIFDKFIRFRYINYKTGQFEELFWSGSLLEQLYEKLKTAADHPMVMVFAAAMHEWKREYVKKATVGDQTLKAGLKERVFQAMNVARNRGLEGLEKNLGFLATVGSTAPFVGLFGTVWGIMDSFQNIAATKNTTLAVVAPGIAEALFATAVGLFAAIPAVIFYNKFSGDLNKISGRVDDFSIEFSSIISRELDSGGRIGR